MPTKNDVSAPPGDLPPADRRTKGQNRFLCPAIMAGKVNLRWVYIHLLEEYAQHTGHADLIRERIDGATGA